VATLQELNKHLVGVEQWAATLEMVQDLLGLDHAPERVKKVQVSAEVRPK
jgi:hypothetical protein